MLTFSDCTGLDITIPGRFLTKFGNPIGLDCKDVRVTIAEGTTAIEESAFQKLPGIVSVTIPKSVTSIGHAAFWQCSGLTDIIVPSSVTEIGDGAFRECTNLTNVTLPDGLTFIGGGVFQGCSLLTNVTLGSGVTSIKDLAFHNAPIRQLQCYAAVPPKLTASSFSVDLTKGATLYVPSGTGTAYSESSWKGYFENIVEMEE